ncbi:MAG: HAMP domain-containing histidine kinase [Spirochaetia bacterium]|nr:HAMP domain-containing histidine kinase [Spirochaetia bacterium]
MNILSFCKSTDFRKTMDCEVIQANENDISKMDVDPRMFHAILIDNSKTAKKIRSGLSKKNKIFIPVIMLLKKNISYAGLRRCMDSGIHDFSLDPYTDLNDIIILNYRKMEQMLEFAEGKINRIRESLVQSIPHEFNTPMTSILGFASIMAKDLIVDPVIQKGFSMNILNSASRLQRVVDSFTYYSHLLIKLSSNCEVCFSRSFFLRNPDQILKLVIHDLQHSFSRKIKYTVSSGIVRCNETNFYKLIFYILENALKFSKSKSAVVVESYNSGEQYHIVIYNEGSGFDMDQLKYLGVFAPMDYDVHNQQGIGMGLAIAQTLLKIYDGDINILSKKNRYTKIEIILKTNLKVYNNNTDQIFSNVRDFRQYLPA